MLRLNMHPPELDVAIARTFARSIMESYGCLGMGYMEARSHILYLLGSGHLLESADAYQNVNDHGRRLAEGMRREFPNRAGWHFDFSFNPSPQAVIATEEGSRYVLELEAPDRMKVEYFCGLPKWLSWFGLPTKVRMSDSIKTLGSVERHQYC